MALNQQPAKSPSPVPESQSPKPGEGGDASEIVVSFEPFSEDCVLPIGAVLRGFKMVERDRTLTHGLCYVLFVLAFVIITSMARAVPAAFDVQRGATQALLETAIKASRHSDRGFLDINSDVEFWAWSEEVLYENIFNKSGLRHSSGAASMSIGGNNRLIGPVRFRQVRTKSAACEPVDDTHQLAMPCWPAYSAGSADNELTKLSPANGSSSSASQYVAAGLSPLGAYGSGGHVVLLDMNANSALEKIRSMASIRWLDEGTRAAAVEVNTYNPNSDVAIALRFLIERQLGGALVASAQVTSCRLSVYSSALDFARAGVEVFWFIGLLGYLCASGRRCCRSGLRTFIAQPWNLTELIFLLSLVVVMLRWYDFISRDRAVFMSRSEAKFPELAPVCEAFNAASNAAGAGAVLAVLPIFSLLLLYTPFAMLWEVLAHALLATGAFVVLALGGLLTYLVAGHWLFGDNVRELHSWQEALGVLSQAAGGLQGSRQQEAVAFFGRLRQVDSTTASMWSVSWVFLSSLVLFNLVVSILVNTFAYIRSRRANQLELEAAFPAPPWTMYFQSKVYPKIRYFSKDPDIMEPIEAMQKEVTAWSKALALVDQDRLKAQVLKDVAAGDRELEVRDAMQLFKASDEAARYRLACDWMKQLSEHAGVKMRRGQEKATTKFEIRVLTEKLNRLEEEACGLALQLQNAGQLSSPMPRFTEPI